MQRRLWWTSSGLRSWRDTHFGWSYIVRIENRLRKGLPCCFYSYHILLGLDQQAHKHSTALIIMFSGQPIGHTMNLSPNKHANISGYASKLGCFCKDTWIQFLVISLLVHLLFKPITRCSRVCYSEKERYFWDSLWRLQIIMAGQKATPKLGFINHRVKCYRGKNRKVSKQIWPNCSFPRISVVVHCTMEAKLYGGIFGWATVPFAASFS